MSDSATLMDCSPPGENTGLGCYALQGIFLTQGLNRSLALQVDSLPTEPPGKLLHVIHYIFAQTHRMHNTKSKLVFKINYELWMVTATVK